MQAFLPCRKGSQRIPDKNVKSFSGVKNGLLEIKLKQLLKCRSIDEIILSSNDERVLEYANSLRKSKITIDERPDMLCCDETTTDELIRYVPTITNADEVLWTHVTSPFITEKDYEVIINKYKKVMECGYDSLMTVKEIKGFIWDKDKAISYNRSMEKWPRTQTIESFFEVDSGVFINSVGNYKKFHDRIGCKPYMFIQDVFKSLDIDWPEQFDIAEKLFRIMNNHEK